MESEEELLDVLLLAAAVEVAEEAVEEVVCAATLDAANMLLLWELPRDVTVILKAFFQSCVAALKKRCFLSLFL